MSEGEEIEKRYLGTHSLLTGLTVSVKSRRKNSVRGAVHGSYYIQNPELPPDIWDLSKSASNDHTDTKPFVRLLGHEDDVHCVKLLLPLVISGSADATVRIWSVEDGGSCLRVLRGHEGKIWAVDADRKVEWRGRAGERVRPPIPLVHCGRLFFLTRAIRSRGLSVSFAEEAFLRKQSS